MCNLRHISALIRPEKQLTDRLSLTNALADADIDRKAAERIATEIFDAIHDNVATKADVAAVNADLQRVEATLRADLQRVEATLRADLQRVDSKLELVSHQLFTRLGGLMVVLAGLLFAALHYWPSRG
jgi:hypothetical protein